MIGVILAAEGTLDKEAEKAGWDTQGMAYERASSLLIAGKLEGSEGAKIRNVKGHFSYGIPDRLLELRFSDIKNRPLVADDYYDGSLV